LNTTVVVAALGYFVDVYDLLLFQIVRKKSLISLGYTTDQLLDEKGSMLITIQMAGLLLGGIFWGILGDKKGRLSVLFGSIFLYSAANLLNGFVTNIETYAILRFIAGVGLAGELGAGITLVSEVMSKETRGYGTMIVASVGVLGAVTAAIIDQYFDWRISYFIGGGLGLMLLLLRISVFESGMFNKIKKSEVGRGNFFALFSTYEKLSTYLKCIFVGLPVWYIIGILITFSSSFAVEMGLVKGSIVDGNSIMFCYIGLVFGDLISGSMSQYFRSRKKVFLIFYIFSGAVVASYFLMNSPSVVLFYSMCLLLGLSVGFWAILVTVSAEQFGTNLRATVATTVPNFVRGSLIPVLLIFNFFKQHFFKGSANQNIASAALVGVIVYIISFIALYYIKETFGKDLDYMEE
ncbi:MAG TPA: MFS transporter, partial [Cytophagaceae bacterium]